MGDFGSSLGEMDERFNHPMTMTRKQQACEQFVRRRRLCQQIEKINNSDLDSGSPLYFYCRHCGIPTEILPEDFIFPPMLECSQCLGLKAEGWLETAAEVAV